MLSEHCSGKAQSPINIITRNAVPDERLIAFQLTGHQKTFHGNLTNNGHTGMCKNLKIIARFISAVGKVCSEFTKAA